MKQFSYTFLVAMILLLGSSCKEVPPFIDYSEPILLAKDTTYVVQTLPSPQPKNVLIEDISGVRCVNCPDAAVTAHEIRDDHPGRVVVMTLHSWKFSGFTRPIADTFNTQVATDIIDNLIGSPSGLPTGSVDRKTYTGKTDPLLPPPTWASFVNDQLNEKSAVNLDLETIHKPGSRDVIVNVTATFLEEQTVNTHLSLFITESHIISPQKSDTAQTGQIDQFEHNFILRAGITSFSGLLLSNSIPAGTVYEKGIALEIPSKYDISNCSIVAIISHVDASGNDVLQVAESEI